MHNRASLDIWNQHWTGCMELVAFFHILLLRGKMACSECVVRCEFTNIFSYWRNRCDGCWCVVCYRTIELGSSRRCLTEPAINCDICCKKRRHGDPRFRYIPVRDTSSLSSISSLLYSFPLSHPVMVNIDLPQSRITKEIRENCCDWVSKLEYFCTRIHPKVSWMPAFITFCFLYRNKMWPVTSSSCHCNFSAMVYHECWGKTNSLSCLCQGTYQNNVTGT